MARRYNRIWNDTLEEYQYELVGTTAIIRRDFRRHAKGWMIVWAERKLVPFSNWYDTLKEAKFVLEHEIDHK